MALFGFVVEHVMEVDPEAAVKFEDGERAVRGAGLLGERGRGREKRGGEKQERSKGGWAHVESHDSIANSCGAQTRGFFLFPNLQ